MALTRRVQLLSWLIDTSMFPEGSVVWDGIPDGHVSVFATPDEIRAAIVDIQDIGLKQLADGSYRLP